MNTRLEKLLKLALNKGTGEAEASAALNAARKLCENQNLDDLIMEVPEMESWSITLEVTAAYQASFIENLYKAARKFKVDVEMISCTHMKDSVTSGLKLELKWHGSSASIKALGDLTDGWILEMNKKRESTKQCWWKKWFG